jgi:hypothetical protein
MMEDKSILKNSAIVNSLFEKITQEQIATIVKNLQPDKYASFMVSINFTLL